MINRRLFLTAAGLAPFAKAGKTLGARTSRKYRACVIGDTQHGGYGHHLHLMWQLDPRVELAALADPDEQGRAKRAAEAGAPRTYADYRQMLEKERPQVVSIAPRWTINHRDLLLACARAGAHGLMEKPLAVDLAEADIMVEAIEARGLKWSIAFNFRASPIIDHARRLILEEDLIGDVLEIRSRGKEDRRAGGEDLIVLGVHVFDLMATFLGPPKWCSASITCKGRVAQPNDVQEATEPLGPVVGDRLQAMFGFAGGVNGYFSSMKNRDGNGGRWGIEIYGSRGIVTVRMNAIPEVLWLPDPSWAPGSSSQVWRPLPDAPNIAEGQSRVWHYTPIVRDLIDSIEADRRPRFSFYDGRMANEMIQAVFESHVQQGNRVTIPLQQRDHPLRRWG